MLPAVTHYYFVRTCNKFVRIGVVVAVDWTTKIQTAVIASYIVMIQLSGLRDRQLNKKMSAFVKF